MSEQGGLEGRGACACGPGGAGNGRGNTCGGQHTRERLARKWTRAAAGQGVCQRRPARIPRHRLLPCPHSARLQHHQLLCVRCRTCAVLPSSPPPSALYMYPMGPASRSSACCDCFHHPQAGAHNSRTLVENFKPSKIPSLMVALPSPVWVGAAWMQRVCWGEGGEAVRAAAGCPCKIPRPWRCPRPCGSGPAGQSASFERRRRQGGCAAGAALRLAWSPFESTACLGSRRCTRPACLPPRGRLGC